MKKFVFLIVLINCCYAQIPKTLGKYVKKVQEKTTYKQTHYKQGKIQKYIAKIAAEKDMEVLKYLLENAYSGKDYWKEQGVNFSQMYIDLKEHIKNKSMVKILDLENILARHLGQIQDGHLTIIGTRKYTFFKHKDAYFADILLEKIEGK